MRRMAWVAVAALAVAARAGAQQGVSVSAGALMPIGALGNVAGTGIGLSLRSEAPLPWWQLDYRVDIALDHLPGKGSAPTLEYTSFAIDAVQWPSRRLYDFAGIGLYNSRSTRASSAFGRSGSLIGVQGGVGLVFETRYVPFVEFGVTNLFASGDDAPWFSVRTGVHF